MKAFLLTAVLFVVIPSAVFAGTVKESQKEYKLDEIKPDWTPDDKEQVEAHNRSKMDRATTEAIKELRNGCSYTDIVSIDYLATVKPGTFTVANFASVDDGLDHSPKKALTDHVVVRAFCE